MATPVQTLPGPGQRRALHQLSPGRALQLKPATWALRLVRPPGAPSSADSTIKGDGASEGTLGAKTATPAKKL